MEIPNDTQYKNNVLVSFIHKSEVKLTQVPIAEDREKPIDNLGEEILPKNCMLFVSFKVRNQSNHKGAPESIHPCVSYRIPESDFP